MPKKDFALNYLENGWSVFPANGKKPIIDEWKPYSITRPTKEQVIEWWTKWPGADIAGVTGEISGIVVVDVDGGEVPPLPPTAVSETSPGHYQYFFKHPGFPVQNSTKVIASNVDIKADGGYVILPPSRHFNKESGKQDFTYKWSIPPKDAGFAELPANILEKIKSKKPVVTIVRGVPEGERNNSAASYIGKLLKRFSEEEWEAEVWPIVQDWNSRNNPPLPEDELESVFESISQREIENKEGQGDLSGDGRRTVADKLVDLTIALGAQLYLDQLNEPHITFPERPIVGFPIKSSVLRRWLSGKYWAENGKGFSGEAFLQAASSLEGKAFHEGNTKLLFNRIAKHDNEIYYDLGNDRVVVKITSTGWEITSECPVRFRRFNHQLNQDEPIKGGKLDKVLSFVNLKSDTDKLLFLTYLVATFIPNIPRVIVVNIGDQGSAKSTALRIIRSLIDPSVSELLSPPSDINELAQAANHHYCLYLDNLSHLRDELSDALCRLATGIGFTKRKLFSDDEDILFSQKVAIGVTGINLVAEKADLLDRCLILGFERIPDNKRIDEEEFWSHFQQEKPYLLGALFDTLSQVLKIIPGFKLPSKPRMADYAKYAACAAISLNKSAEEFLAAFNENVSRQNQAAIESSPTAQVILQFIADKDSWSGASAVLYQQLKELAEKLNLHIGGSDGFPKSSSWLWKRIMQIRPNLLSLGIQVSKDETNTSTVISITKTLQESKNTATTTTDATQTPASSGSMAAVAASNPSLDANGQIDIKDTTDSNSSDFYPFDNETTQPEGKETAYDQREKLGIPTWD